MSSSRRGPATGAPVHGAVGSPVSDSEAMALALEQASGAAEAGDVPVGAVVVHRGQVLSMARNERERRGDPTAHAEVLALRAAAEQLGTWRLDGASLVVTLEPCPMCAGAAMAARVDRIVFGAPNPEAGACGSLYNLCVDPRLNHEATVVPGIRSEESAALLTTFFAGRRPT